jgi:putative ABC transport system permease protein
VTGVAVALVLVVIAIVVSRVQGLRLESELVTATVRATVQLVLVASIITVVFEEFVLVVPALGVMLALAAWTSGGRLKGIPRARWLAGGAIAIASTISLVVLFAGRALSFEPRFLVPIAGMLIGNSMAVTSLAGARLRDEVTDKVLEIEARLALGVSAREALQPYARRAISAAMIPTIDATKNAGLILLPGAFVGTILGGASPARAAEIQLIVLFMLLGAISIAGMTATILVSRVFVAPGERISLPVPGNE